MLLGAMVASNDARAEACGAAACPQAPPNGIPTVRLEQLGDNGVKLFSNDGHYTIAVTGSDSSAGFTGTGLSPGEAWHRSLDAEMHTKLGYFFNMDLLGDFTRVKRDADAELFSLQPLDSVGDNRRALEKLDLKFGFFDNRLTFSSSRHESSLTPLGSNGLQAVGLSEQDRFGLWLWRSGKDGLSLDGASSRVDPGYQDLMKIHTTDPLQTPNRETRQLRSNLNVGWAGFFVATRDAAAIVPDQHGDRPKSAEVEAGVSVKLAGLREENPAFSFLPDSIWASISRGSIEHSLAASPPGQTEKSAIGLTRNWAGGGLNVSYWQSTVDAVAPLPAEAEWRGHGVDLGGNVGSGRWSMSGDLSWYAADNAGLMNNGAENSLGGSIFVNWRAPSWPKLSAGITNYDYQADFLDLHGLQRNSAMRYQLMLDSTPLLNGLLSEKSARLSLLASFDANNYRSEWSRTGYSGGSGNMFFGFRLARPILP